MHDARHDWTADGALGLIGRPLRGLLADARNVHRQRLDPRIVEGAMLLPGKIADSPLLG
jgi:hypothetical protein